MPSVSQKQFSLFQTRRFLPLFVAQFLGTFRVIPNAGFSQFQFYLGEPVFAIGEVKDTP